LGFGEAEGLGEGLGDTDGEGEADGLGEGLTDGEGLGDSEGVGDALSEGDGLGDADGLASARATPARPIWPTSIELTNKLRNCRCFIICNCLSPFISLI
jgi:hypothetical protein